MSVARSIDMRRDMLIGSEKRLSRLIERAIDDILPQLVLRECLRQKRDRQEDE